MKWKDSDESETLIEGNIRFTKLGSLALLEGNLREFPDSGSIIQCFKKHTSKYWKKIVKQTSEFKEAWHQCKCTFLYSSNNIVTEASVRAWLSMFLKDGNISVCRKISNGLVCLKISSG